MSAKVYGLDSSLIHDASPKDGFVVDVVRFSDYAVLEKKCQSLVAENAVMKSGATYFACGSEYGFDLFRDKQAAIDVCLQEIELHREGYLDGDGWDDGVGRTAWGIIIQSAQGRDAQGIHESEAGHTYQTCDYQLEDEIKTTTTTQTLNEIKAQGVDELAEAFKSWADDSNGDYEAERHWAVASKEALSFAASLRGKS
ncbi:hypothetical protein [Yersinia vastinensis]|uniref:hypothetical protein n=1 Tax=Yersinia vastinensis TaxID=2890318 RepID=UPI0011A05029|nr:hypothetical protein [Yersinia vastinensis]